MGALVVSKNIANIIHLLNFVKLKGAFKMLNTPILQHKSPEVRIFSASGRVAKGVSHALGSISMTSVCPGAPGFSICSFRHALSSFT
jgi:hypothetical protein